jgi:hypothetical protein
MCRPMKPVAPVMKIVELARIFSPVSRNMAPDRCHGAPGWTEGHSHHYGLKEGQVQLYMDKPEPG